jgi:hypothetical protein
MILSAFLRRYAVHAFWQLAFLAVVALLLFNASSAQADNWTMSITVDNHYNIYFGDQFLTVPTSVGGDGNWPDTETWNINGVAATDFLYVATASDHAVAQGFIGQFKNLTTGYTFVTSDDSGSPWEVFPAGYYLAALNAIDPTIPAISWPGGTQPTVAQVQTAVAYATSNNLWIATNSAANYTNGNNPAPWGTRPAIPAIAEWIWHDSGNVPGGAYPSPFEGGNHKEFLVFRVAGAAIPEPAAFVLLGVGVVVGVAGLRRRHSR